jgi:hypothetical protein
VCMTCFVGDKVTPKQVEVGGVRRAACMFFTFLFSVSEDGIKKRKSPFFYHPTIGLV